MYKKDLDLLLQKTSPRAALLYGESEFFIQYYSHKIAAKFTDNSNKTTFYFSDYSKEHKDPKTSQKRPEGFQPVMNILSQSSLFGDKSLVVLKLDKKLSKKEIQDMLQAISQNETNALIVEFYQAESRSNTQYAQDFRTLVSSFKHPKLGNSLVEVRFFTPNFYESMALLREKANALGLKIEDRLLGSILSMQNNDLAIACNELEKFSILEGDISIDDIQRLSYGLGSVHIDELYNGLFDKKNALEVYEKIQEEGMEDLALLREIEKYFYQLFLFFAYIKTHGMPNAKEILGFSPPQAIAERLGARSIRIKEDGYRHIFEALRKWRSLSMGGEKNAGLSALIKLQAFIR